MNPLVKICGTTSPHDARLAHAAGADFLGVVVEHPPSPRGVSLAAAQAIRDATPLPLVALTVNLPLSRLLEIYIALQPTVMQLHGDETPDIVRALASEGARVWTAIAGETDFIRRRAALMLNAGAEAILVDARAQSSEGVVYGGTGHRGNWNAARELAGSGARIVLAGGLNAGNVSEAIEVVRPWAVDAVSGVEARKGVKDDAKVREFVRAARGVI